MENKRTYDLSNEDLEVLRDEVDKYTVEGDLRRKVRADIQLLKDIGCYRGRRHSMVIPSSSDPYPYLTAMRLGSALSWTEDEDERTNA